MSPHNPFHCITIAGSLSLFHDLSPHTPFHCITIAGSYKNMFSQMTFITFNGFRLTNPCKCLSKLFFFLEIKFVQLICLSHFLFLKMNLIMKTSNVKRLLFYEWLAWNDVCFAPDGTGRAEGKQIYHAVSMDVFKWRSGHDNVCTRVLFSGRDCVTRVSHFTQSLPPSNYACGSSFPNCLAFEAKYV